ncbi:PPE domain-containing protein [Saccharothrix sp.]|uniref:PPE domain-containing protein n=1 Tax=Saccharothrix sp. TaxID=1873460 RepID=UPI0028113D81|nr:PPE domain-containing protein [Saccharothrix sp.]
MTEQRKHRYWSDDHRPSARARRRARRVKRDKEANRLPENFGHINWAVYTHREMWDMVKSADTGRMGKRAHDWQSLAADVDRATGDVQQLVQRLVMSWHGPSSVVAAESASRLTEWAADASRRAYGVGTGMTAYTSAVEEAARRMPEPVHPDAEKWFREGYDVTTLDGPEGAYFLRQLLDDHRPDKEEQQAAKARAVDVMVAYEHASRGVYTELPTFDAAAPPGAQIHADQAPVPAPGSGGVVPAPGRPQDTTTVAAVTGPSGYGPGGSGPGGYGPGGYGPGGFGPGGAGPGGFGPGGGTGSGGAVPGGFGPGGVGTGRGAGFGPGGSAGVLGAAGPGVVARGGVVGPAGAAGAAGYGMYPPVAPANQEEDREHRNRYDNGLDLLDDLPPAFPPVLGE